MTVKTVRIAADDLPVVVQRRDVGVGGEKGKGIGTIVVDIDMTTVEVRISPDDLPSC